MSKRNAGRLSVAMLTLMMQAFADHTTPNVPDEVIASQRVALAAATKGKGYGPQTPRDLAHKSGNNLRVFSHAPKRTQMNLCNIHFHSGAEHKGGEFTTYLGNGDGQGHGTGYGYSGHLSAKELAPFTYPVGSGEKIILHSGDTIEIHYVHSSAQVQPGSTLASCVSDTAFNPNLRVETVVAVLVNDRNAEKMQNISTFEKINGYYQATNLPNNLGEPIVYTGSTTGANYNEKASPFHVTWSIRPKVIKLDIASAAKWLKDNPFDEHEAHNVRNLVLNEDLLSPIQ